MAFLLDGIQKLAHYVSGAGAVDGGVKGRKDGVEDGLLGEDKPEPDERAAQLARQHEVETFTKVLEEVRAGKLDIRILMRAMAELRYELEADVASRLMGYLMEPKVTKELPWLVLEDSEDRCAEDARKVFVYSYVASSVLAFGPATLQDTLLSEESLLDRLLDLFRSQYEIDPRRVVNVCTVLYALLRRNSSDVLRRLAIRGDDISNMMHHFGHSAIAEFIVHLLNENQNMDGGDNARTSFLSALPVLSNARIFDQLASKFEDCAENIDRDYMSNESLENAVYTFRYLVLQLNSKFHLYRSHVAMRLLDVYSNPVPVMRILVAGLTAAETDSHAKVLGHSARLCSGLIKAHQETIRSSSRVEDWDRLTRLEKLILSETRELVAVLMENTDYEGDAMLSLGVSRLEIVELFSSCFEFGSRETREALLSKGVVASMFELLQRHTNNSMLHHIVVRCIDLLLYRSDAGLRKSLFFDQALVKRVLDAWKKHGDEWGLATAPSYLSALIQMSFCIWDCMDNVMMSDPTEDVQALISPRVLRDFELFSMRVLTKAQVEWPSDRDRDMDAVREAVVHGLGDQWRVGTPRPRSPSTF